MQRHSSPPHVDAYRNERPLTIDPESFATRERLAHGNWSGSKGKLLFIASNHVAKAKLKNLQHMAPDYGLDVQYKLLRGLPKDVSLEELVKDADLVVFDAVSSGDTERSFSRFAPAVERLSAHTRFLAIRWPDGDSLRAGVTEDQAQLLHDYSWNGGKENFRRMLAYIARDVFGQGGQPVAVPIRYPDMGVYHPDYSGRVFDTVDEYLAWQQQRGLSPERGVIAISMHREVFASDTTQMTDAIIRKLEAKGETPLAFYYLTGKDAPDYLGWLEYRGNPIVNAMINTRVIHWAEKRRAEFETLGVPVIQTMNYPGTETEWRQDPGGIPSNLIPFYFTLSEISGVSDPITVGVEADDGLGNAPMEAQIDMLVSKATRLARLKYVPNDDKRVAILYYNYPPGERSASASFLNIPRSLELLFAAMRKEGYRAEELKEQTFIDAVAEMQRPFYRDIPPAELVSKGLADTLSLSRYRSWFDSLPVQVQHPVLEDWGQPEEHFMVDTIDGEPHFVIPMLRSGNLRVLPQPPRGNKNEREKSVYHSKSVSVNHYYLAVYLHLREEYGADALVHLGTHGSHEWLPGKERGLWAYDPGNLTAGDLPVVYPYIVDDVGEALQAKRRGRAITISHMTPPFAPSGLYRELSEVHELMHQYSELEQGLVRERTKNSLLALTGELGLLKDMSWEKAQAEQQFEDYVSALHDYLHELGTENQPLGLHTWGKVAEDRLLTTTLLQILGPDFNAALHEHGEGTHTHDSDHQHGHSHSHLDHGHVHGNADHGHMDPGVNHVHGAVGAHSHTAASEHGPNDGVLGLLMGDDQEPLGYVELKLHDDKGDLELWIARDKDITQPVDLPLSASPTVVFEDGRKARLSVRNRQQNEDEDGNGNIRGNKTNYFIYPGDTDADASWLQGASFNARAQVLFEIEGEPVATEAFTLTPHSHHQADNGVTLETLPGFHLVQHYVVEGQEFDSNIPEAIIPFLEKGRDVYQRIVNNKEMSSFIAALAGRYVPSSTGGDPIRNDASLPTGRNLYGFDPSRVPTKAAWEAGQQLVASMIEDHRATHGRYPDKMAFSLWSIETMRHYGVLEAQALYAMGVRPVWAKNGRVTGTEIIPYEELGRPRVDVVLSATGLYRDAFPGVMKLIADGVSEVARLKEENNFVYRHSQQLREELESEGLSPEEAEYLSTARIFSNASGTYGTGLAAGTLASDTWDDDGRLAEMYLDRMGHVFGSDESRWGEKLSNVDLYARNLSGTDIALFSRTSNVYGLLTSDDPFQYLGGISLAVRHLDGQSPEMYISNLRNPKQGKTETLGRFLSKELRTRYLHPRWVTEMQTEGYSGTLSVLDAMNNFWGWQVVDPQNVRDDQWQAFYDVYVNDIYELDMRAWFETHNAETLAQITERMLEAVRKEYWQADDATVQELVQLYDELRLSHQVVTANTKFTEFVETSLQGYGLAQPQLTDAPEVAQPALAPPPASAVEMVQGQRLEKTAAEPIEPQLQWLVWVLLLALITLVGYLRQQELIPMPRRWAGT